MENHIRDKCVEQGRSIYSLGGFMIFLAVMGSAFLYGAIKGYSQWKAQQQTVFVQRGNSWKN